jgi:hypothetical protein
MMRLALFAVLAALALARPASAQVINPPPNGYQFSFLACNFVPGCPNPTEFARFTYFGTSPLAAPALGPNNIAGNFRSDLQEVVPIAYGAGFWEHVYLMTYRNIFGQSGSSFLFDRLDPANGNDYGQFVLIDAFVSGPTRNPLVWEPGLYTGLIAATCPDLLCYSSTGAVESVRLLITQAELTWPQIVDLGGNKPETVAIGAPGAPVSSDIEVPEPASALLLAAGLVALARHRRK